MPPADNAAVPKQHELAGTDIDTADSTEATQASTLTDPANMSALQQMMTNHPALVQQFLTNNPQFFKAPTPSSPSNASPPNTQGGFGGRS
jgi:hypothetical protein